MNKLESVKYTSVESIVTSWDYYQVIESLVDSIIYSVNEAIECEQVNDKDDIEELINDSLLHETIDSSQYAIYYNYHLPIIHHSDNDEYFIDNFGAESLEHALKKDGLTGLHSIIAFWCLYADVQERLYEILEEYESE